MMSARLAIDIGGTFTDVVLELDDGRRETEKLLTTQGYPGEAVLRGIGTVMRAAGASPSEVSLIIHGTTLATNALIERRGATTALLTTDGHRDALEMAHEDRFEQYDINIDRPVPLVPRFLRLPIPERLDRDGNVLVPLDEGSVMATLPLLEEHGVDSVAIGFLHAFVNPAHEQRTAELLQAARPDLSITLASEVCPEIREFERLSTACANAYVRPLMARYLERLGGELSEQGFTCPFLMMTSGGGLTTLETATKFPIRLVESGPAGGAILAQKLASTLGMDRLLSFDMGGTTAKLCLIDDFAPLMSRSFEVDRVYRFKKGSGLPVRIPVIEMVEIGAGGGSIARIDRLQRIQTGPESAGSEPGPAAYGRGGEQPTVTDADAVLGRIRADGFRRSARTCRRVRPRPRAAGPGCVWRGGSAARGAPWRETRRATGRDSTSRWRWICRRFPARDRCLRSGTQPPAIPVRAGPRTRQSADGRNAGGSGVRRRTGPHRRQPDRNPPGLHALLRAGARDRRGSACRRLRSR
jgi:N-methylhydantoinase A